MHFKMHYAAIERVYLRGFTLFKKWSCVKGKVRKTNNIETWKNVIICNLAVFPAIFPTAECMFHRVQASKFCHFLSNSAISCFWQQQQLAYNWSLALLTQARNLLPVSTTPTKQRKSGTISGGCRPCCWHRWHRTLNFGHLREFSG